MTWDKLIEFEPKLKKLYERAQGYHEATKNAACGCRHFYKKPVNGAIETHCNSCNAAIPKEG